PESARPSEDEEPGQEQRDHGEREGDSQHVALDSERLALAGVLRRLLGRDPLRRHVPRAVNLLVVLVRLGRHERLLIWRTPARRPWFGPRCPVPGTLTLSWHTSSSR